MTLSYCPPNETLSIIWINHGLSRCFINTISPIVISAFLFVSGTIQLLMYKKYGTEIAINHLVKSKLFNLQIFFTLFVPLLEIIKFTLSATIIEDKTVYGYMILSLILTLLMYPFSICLINKERKYLLPSIPTRGHGLVLLMFWTLIFINENLSFINLGQKNWWFHLKTTSDQIEMCLFVLRYISCLNIFMLGLKAPGVMQNADYFSLNDSNLRNNMNNPNNDDNTSTWKNAWKKFKMLAPFMWPKKDHCLQLKVLVCVLLLIGGRCINLFVPMYNKLIANSMLIESNPKMTFRWDLILIYVTFKFLQGGGTGGMGLLNNLRSFLWIRVQQYTTREVQVELFRHLHSLSLRWHLKRKTGEVLRVMDRGTESINNLLNYIIFSIAPTILDIIVAVAFFVVSFNIWFGLIVFVTMILYIVLTVTITEWRTKFQRRMNLADNETRTRSVDSLLNFETVKYFGAERYEVDAFRSTILNFQDEEWKSTVTLNILNTVQNVIICAGLLGGSLLCVNLIVHKLDGFTVGDYVLFTTYIVQLYVPLNWFGTYYRAIQKNFVDMENMFDLLREDQEVIDAPGAGPLLLRKGRIEFDNVSFGYMPEKLILKNISFVVPEGKTVAIVGPSGSGKSTIIRLLFRFYDVETGAITIDGQNIKTVTQESLRRAIGVVPQDTVLFNNTIKFNIKYGRIDATDMGVIDAARLADIHDTILSYPETYDTQVGERGLRLSGGEKQRVAIARTLLKPCNIVLLDEATSSLDTRTERNIQDALKRVCSNRTTIVVAHRLSTIVNADEILVIKDGEIVDRGTHQELVGQAGVYADMWRAQSKDEPSSTTTTTPSTSLEASLRDKE